MTNACLILDESGSMEAKYNETIVAVDEYLRGIREDHSVDRVYMTTFATGRINRIYDGVPVAEVSGLSKGNYNPRGGTPLFDAVGQTVSAMQGDRMFVIVITDGEENASHTYTLRDIKRMIEEREAQGWDFIFLGADINAWSANARGMGITRGKTLSFSGAEMSMGMDAARRATADYSRTGQRLPDDYFEQGQDDYHEGYFEPNNN